MDEEEKKSAGEELVNEGKKWAGKQLMKKLAPWIIKISIPFIIIIILGALVFSVFNSTGDKLEDILDSVVDFFTVDYEGRWGDRGTIYIEENEVETIINSIDEMGISIEGLKLLGEVDYSDPNVKEQYEEALKEYIRKFYEAQAMTQTINIKPNWFEENILSGGKPYGTVYVHRSEGEQNPQTTDSNQMKYMPYDEMKSKAEAGNTSVAGKYFSIDEEGNIVIAGWDKTTVKKNGVVVSEETKVNLHYIDYKRALEQYTTPMNFFFYLAMTAENPEFVEAVIDLVKRSEIRLMVFDTEKEMDVVETLTYTVNNRVMVPVVNDRDDLDNPVTEYEEQIISTPVTEITETNTKSLTPNLEVVFAETWFSEQTITFNKKTTPYKDEQNIDPGINGSSSADSWISDANLNINTNTNVEEYVETLRGDVIDKLGERGDPGIKDLNGNNQVDENEKVDEETTFLGLMDDRFIIPNTTRPSAAGSNLISGAEIFFHLLQKDSSTQFIEQVMRYAFYKYTQRSYGVEDLNFDMFDAKEFETIGSGLYGNTTEEKLWFGLREAGFSEYAAAGVISNLWAKSGLRSNHLNDDSEKYVGMTDQQYTEAVNNGTYSVDKFISDHKANNRGAGYGIAEWTSSSSKEGLYYFAQSRGVGIDDEDMQIEYLIAELKESGGADGFAQYTLGNYKGYTVDSWKNATSAEEAAKAFYWISEKPSKDETALRVARANEYYKEYQGKSHAICEESDDKIVKCYYTSTSGRKFTVLNQTTIKTPVNWSDKCNRAAAAIIASGYSNESPSAIVTSMNIEYSKEGDPIIPTKFFEQYGLERTTFQIGGLSVSEYTTKLREQLQNGGYAAIWVSGNAAYGKSKKWASGEYHWVAIIDYRNNNGKEEIVIADWNGADWYDIDEFKNGISFLSLISEKK